MIQQSLERRAAAIFCACVVQVKKYECEPSVHYSEKNSLCKSKTKDGPLDGQIFKRQSDRDNNDCQDLS